MPLRLDSREPGFAAAFDALLNSKREVSEEVGTAVASILADVRQRGDEAVIEYTARFDKLPLTPSTLAFSSAEIDAADASISGEVRAALQFAHDRIAAHHEKQKPLDHVYQDALGVTLGTVWTPMEAVGIYVPGGTANYPSSVLMGAVPARIAGVDRIALTVPTPGGVVSAAVLAAAKMAGVTEVYRLGGAQAIAALAYGTDTIQPVNKIIGPGNAYVAAAKRQVFGAVGIDSIAGPSEVLIIADASANPSWVAADLLAQAEHGGGAQSILVTTDAALADAAEAEVERQLACCRAPRSRATAGKSSAPSSPSPRSPRRWNSPTASLPNTWSWRWTTHRRCCPGSGMPAPSSSATTRPRRSATMSAARTTCCPPPARRATHRASACSIS